MMDDINYRKVQMADIKPLSEIMGKAFLQQDRLLQKLDVTLQDMQRLLEVMIAKTMEQELCFVAVGGDGEVFGGIYFYTPEMFTVPDDITPEFEHKLSCLNTLNELLYAPLKNKTSAFKYCGGCIAVAKKSEGKGISNRLIKMGMKYIESKYDGIITNAITLTSKKLSERNGATCINTVKYAKSGIPEFADVPGACYLMYKPNHNLDC